MKLAWIDSSLDFDKLTDDESNYLFHKVGLCNDLTKNELEKLQKEKQALEIKLATLKNANNSPIDVDKCYHFLYSLLKLDLNLIANRKKLINIFVRKVMLSDEEIKILFYPINKPGVFNESNRNLKEQDDNSDTSSSSVTVGSPIDIIDKYVITLMLITFCL